MHWRAEPWDFLEFVILAKKKVKKKKKKQKAKSKQNQNGFYCFDDQKKSQAILISKSTLAA